jgi:hypothetical protein
VVIARTTHVISWPARIAVLLLSLALAFFGIAPSIAEASPGLSTVDLTDVALDPTGMANALVGTGVSVSNVTYSGAETASGTFAGGTGIIGFESGILLTSGSAANVIGPNVEDAKTTSHGGAGDTDLDTLSGVSTFDAAILEFDFVPDADTVFFQYVFSSDEYNEFVNSAFNDVFGFFVNGTNCAVVGDPPVAVSINTINNGNPFGNDPKSHPDLYINNDLTDGGGAIDTEMDGLSVVLTCEAAVNTGVTNHMKLAIADGSDTILDSAVFLKQGSLTTEPPGEGPCGPMDVAFIIDDTGSMGGAIGNVKAEAASLLAQIDTASGSDDQLALVSFKDTIVVHEDLAAGNEAAVAADIAALVAFGGANLPEASDESLNTVVNGLDVADRAAGQQTGDFNGTFRAGAVKIAILVTDALPGGFDDAFTAGVDDVNAHARAVEAAAAGILISAIYVPTGGVDATEAAIMTDYATTTGGTFTQTNADGTGSADAIASIIENCGQGNNVAVTKFYDANANGTQDAGEVDLTGWVVTIDNSVHLVRLTPVAEMLEAGEYTVAEATPVEPNWVPTTDTSLALTVIEGQQYDLTFGNVCLGAGGGKTLGYWSNKNGQALIGDDDLAALSALHLRNADGTNFDPASKAALKTWLLNATANNMAYMLSAQLAAMALNVHNGLVAGSALVYAPGAPSANAAGFLTVDQLIADADAALAADGLTPSGDANRALQETLKNALDAANKNLSFVQAEACAFSFEELIAPAAAGLSEGQ